MVWQTKTKKQSEENKMMKQPINHDELEELYYERIENKMPKRELINLRNKYDQGWNKK